LFSYAGENGINWTWYNNLDTKLRVKDEPDYDKHYIWQTIWNGSSLYQYDWAWWERIPWEGNALL